MISTFCQNRTYSQVKNEFILQFLKIPSLYFICTIVFLCPPPASKNNYTTWYIVCSKFFKIICKFFNVFIFSFYLSVTTILMDKTCIQKIWASNKNYLNFMKFIILPAWSWYRKWTAHVEVNGKASMAKSACRLPL